MQILHRTFKAGTFALAIFGAGILFAASRSGGESSQPTESDTSQYDGGSSATIDASHLNSSCALAARTYGNFWGSADNVFLRCVDQQEHPYESVSR